MSNVYFFRGKAATGKTTITDILSKKINVPVMRKDDIFDILSRHTNDNLLNNNLSYDILARLIQTNIINKTDIIVDVGLSSTKGWKMFVSKLDFKDCKVFNFLCDCTDIEIWKMRFEERLNNPTPNQYFKTVDEMVGYYAKSDIELLECEIYIDSSKNIESILNFIIDKIRIA